MLIPVAAFAFVFVTLVVGGFRALDLLAKHKAKVEAERRARIKSRAGRRDYTGPLVNHHGREIG